MILSPMRMFQVAKKRDRFANYDGAIHNSCRNMEEQFPGPVGKTSPNDDFFWLFFVGHLREDI